MIEGSADEAQDGTAAPAARAGERRGRRGRGTMRRTPDQPCLNCGDTTYGDYCPRCGQAKRTVAVSVHALVTDVLEDQLVLNRALPRTLFALVARPGFLTTEYVEGRIVRYIAPFRLYLVASVVFFLLLSFWGTRALERMDIGSGPELSAVDVTEAAVAVASIDTADLSPQARMAVAQARAAITQAAGDSADLVRTAAPGDIQPWAQTLRINIGGQAMDSTFRARIIDRYGRLPFDVALRQFLPEYIGYLPHMVFVLLPIFAFMLKVLYIRRRRFYAEHFVFSLHVHAFVFLMFILMLLWRNDVFITVLFVWILIYLWLAMKRVYGQGWFRTTVKYWTLGFVYTTLLTIALALMIFVPLLLA